MDNENKKQNRNWKKYITVAALVGSIIYTLLMILQIFGIGLEKYIPDIVMIIILGLTLLAIIISGALFTIIHIIKKVAGFVWVLLPIPIFDILAGFLAGVFAFGICVLMFPAIPVVYKLYTDNKINMSEEE